jgi:predicted nucleic acid-binding protein
VGKRDVKYVIDSNIWVYAASGSEPAIRCLDAAVACDWAGYSAISRLEVLGFPGLKPEDETRLEQLLGCLEEVEVHRGIIDQAISIRRRKRIKAPDAIVAATALRYGATLVTRNVDDFKGVDILQVWNPFE